MSQNVSDVSKWLKIVFSK